MAAATTNLELRTWNLELIFNAPGASGVVPLPAHKPAQC